MISTGTVLSLTPDDTIGIPIVTQGVARIVSSSTKVACAAYVIAPNSAPGYMNSLPILKGKKQGGD